MLAAVKTALQNCNINRYLLLINAEFTGSKAGIYGIILGTLSDANTAVRYL